MDRRAATADSFPRRTRLRWTGALALLIGLVAAGMLYWWRTGATMTGDPMLDSFAAAQSRAQMRQMGLLYGNAGVFFEDLLDDLKRPAIQAVIIATLSVLFALGCFYLSSQPKDAASVEDLKLDQPQKRPDA